MQKFIEFINEESEDMLHIETDSRVLENNKDSINTDLDHLTAAPYQNSIVFYNQLRGTLERYGMLIPSGATKTFLNFDAEMSMTLGDSGLHLYVVFNTDKHGKVDAYAQVVDDEELNSLMHSNEDEMDEEEESDDNDEYDETVGRYRKTDDDAGNTGEY